MSDCVNLATAAARPKVVADTSGLSIDSEAIAKAVRDERDR